MSQLPRIHLTVDNCFASKRWTRPREWAGVIRDVGLSCVEANVATERDPFYTGAEYLDEWARDVERAERETGVRVVNVCSGYSTYATLGLAHHDEGVRESLQAWLEGLVRTASRLGTGVAFYCYAFDQATLEDPEAYRKALGRLDGQLRRVAAAARGIGVGPVCLEQMYTPHQVPWTIEGTRELHRRVLAAGGAPLYTMIDTGHQTGQAHFVRRPRPRLEEDLARARRGERVHGLWLGPEAAYRLFYQAAAAPEAESGALLDRVEREMDARPYLFRTAPEDSDPYAWLERLGRYSPIIHLQQNDGSASSHRPFTPEENRRGVIDPRRVLESLSASYSDADEPGMPPPARDVFLTIEIFPSTASVPRDILADLAETVACWREHVPEDGLPLDELVGGRP